MHRTTFYGHAMTIEELTVGAVTRIIDGVPEVDPEDPDPIKAYRSAAFDLFECIIQDRRLLRAVLSSTWPCATSRAFELRTPRWFCVRLRSRKRGNAYLTSPHSIAA